MATTGRDVYLLGAGFSRAICPAMPTMPELREAVFNALELDPGPIKSLTGDLERWLSHLSVDQPWLSDQENARNHALFRDAAEAIKVIIDRAETLAVAQPIPMWLRRLSLTLAARQAAVISLNYDLLLERALRTSDVIQTWGDIYGLPLESRLPVGTHLMFAVPRAGYAPTLLKLHGSTNWAYGGQSAPISDRIVLTKDGLRWRDGYPAPTGRDRALYDDLVPLIVPPTTSKSRYYANLSLRGQWRRAAQDLRGAASLTIVGYSLPSGDEQVHHFLAETVHRQVPVTVVNPDSSAAARVADALGRPCDEVKSIEGTLAIEELVEATCGDVVQWHIKNAAGEAVPELFVNGHDRSDADDASRRPTGDQNAARAWLGDELRRRWPGTLQFEGRDLQPREAENNTAKVAFAPRAITPWEATAGAVEAVADVSV